MLLLFLEKNEIEEVKQYDIVADRQQLNTTLTNSKEVDDIVRYN